MARLLTLLVATLLWLHVANSQQVQSEDKLIFAHVVRDLDPILKFTSQISLLFSSLRQLYRHGDRTPIDPYPNDPWKDPAHWTAGWGQLTNVSKSVASWFDERLVVIRCILCFTRKQNQTGKPTSAMTEARNLILISLRCVIEVYFYAAGNCLYSSV